MAEDKHTEAHYLEWLKKLGRDSWQMELLVSGFSIAAIFSISDYLDEGIQYLAFHANVDGLWQYALIVIQMAVKLTGINLFFHVVLRAFWIGVIGLDSVSSEIDFDKLGYGSFFTEKLRKRVKSLHELTTWLDQICSSIFAFTFLIVLCFISFLLFTTFLIAFTTVINALESISTWGIHTILSHLSSIVGITLFVSSLIYLVDFLTLGWIKKKNWLGRIYYPFYYFYGIITLAPLYRGIYYNFIHQFSKRKLGLIFFAYLSLSFMFHAYTFEYYIFIPDKIERHVVQSNHYENQLGKDAFISTACIQNDIITDPFIRLFIRYNVRDNDALINYCYKPVLKEGFNRSKGTNFYINERQVVGRPKSEAKPHEALACLSDFYGVYLNNERVDSLEYLFHTHTNKKEIGIVTYIPTANLPQGKNTLEIRKRTAVTNNSTDSNTTDTTHYQLKFYTQIPFWLAQSN
ncbi:MAG: hypothetical protein ACPGJS_15085 [Flammeovirgaceae bacterium]